MEKVIDCPVCYNADKCFEDVQETFSSYLCFACGFMSDSRYEFNSLQLLDNLKKSPKLVTSLQFIDKMNRENLKLKGSELISVINIEKGISPLDKVGLEIKYISGDIKKIKTLCRIDTKNELEYYKNGGILQYVLRNMI